MAQAVSEEQQRELGLKLEQLSLLCQVSPLVCAPTFDAPRADDESDDWTESNSVWTVDDTTTSDSSSLPDYFAEDEDETHPCLYDPTLFSSSRSLHRISDTEKPLPDIPPTQPLRIRVPLAPPSSPRTSRPVPFTPPSSPRTVKNPVSSSPAQARAAAPYAEESHNGNYFTMPVDEHTELMTPTQPLPPRHSTFPSISSTLSILGERETNGEKRTAVYVDELSEIGTHYDAVSSHSGSARGSNDSNRAYGQSSLRQKKRPTLPLLATSTSSPQLRTLAMAAATPTSTPLSTPPPLVQSHEAATFVASTSVPATQISRPIELEKPLSSRWSLDSIASRPSGEALQTPITPIAEEIPKRSRFMSFISRSRAGSLGKAATPIGTPDEGPTTPRPSISREGLFGMVSPTRPSLPIQSPPITMSSAGSGPSTSPLTPPKSAPSERSSLSISDTFSSVLNEAEDALRMDDPFGRGQDLPPSPPPSPPPLPTLPAPSPSQPSPSFLLPQQPQGLFAAFKRRPRHAKKMVISGVFLGQRERNHSSGNAYDEDLQPRWVREQKVRHDNVVRWCESFGRVKRIEEADDGSLHVYWHKWEVADMVCRVRGQVFIQGVGRVSLAWHYIS